MALSQHPLCDSVDADAASNRVHVILGRDALVVVEVLGFVPSALDLTLTLE